MSLVLEDTLAATKTLAANFKIVGRPFKKRSSLSAIAYKDGARNISDRKVEPRVMQIEGILNAANAAAYETAKNGYFSWLYKEDLKLYYDASLYINVKIITDVDEKFYDGGFLRLAKVSFNCQCEDPFWYYVAATTDVKVIGASPTTWIIANAGDYTEYPEITIVNAADNTTFTLENLTTGKTLGYYDTNFLNADTLVIDNKIGTVKMNGANTIDKISGSFLNLLVGNNSIRYTGANCTITTKWYKKEL